MVSGLCYKNRNSLVRRFNDDNQVRNYVTFIFQSKFTNVTESRVILLSVQKVLKSDFKLHVKYFISETTASSSFGRLTNFDSKKYFRLKRRSKIDVAALSSFSSGF